MKPIARTHGRASPAPLPCSREGAAAACTPRTSGSGRQRPALSLRGRLSLSLLALTAVALVLALALAVVRTRAAVQAEMAASAALALALLDDGAIGAVAAPQAQLERLRALGRHRHLVIDLVEAPASAPALDEPAAPAWFVRAVAADAPHYTRSLARSDGAPLHLRIHADPADEIAEAWSDFRALLLLFAGFAALVNAVAFHLAGRISAPIGMLGARLDALAAGDYTGRTAAPGLPELARIARHIDRLAACLATSRAENRRLAAHALSVREAERRWLAAEMHDELGQSLTAIQVDAATLAHLADDEAMRACAEAILVNSGAIQTTVRELIRRLHPMALEALGLRMALAQMCADWSARAACPPVMLDWDAALPEPVGCGIHAYRIVQECLTNVARHAQARTATVTLRGCGDWLDLCVRDDGRGYDPQRPTAGFGLAGLRVRAESLGGALVIVTAPGAGVEVRARLPLHGPGAEPDAPAASPAWAGSDAPLAPVTGEGFAAGVQCRA